MQVSMLGAHLRLRSKLADWYRNLTSVSYGHLLIDLLPRTHDQLRFYSNAGSIPSKLSIPDRLKQLKLLDDEHTISLYFPESAIFSHKCKNVFLQSFRKEFNRFLHECIVNFSNGNQHSKETSSSEKTSKRSAIALCLKITWKQGRDFLLSQKRVTTHKVSTPPHVIYHLS